MVVACNQAVMAVDEERQRLEREAESLLGNESEEAQTRLEDLYERCERSHKSAEIMNC